jgi:hypothetical protein
MTFFDESGEYWGNQTTPVIGAGDGRLSARSVKIFADGMHVIHSQVALLIFS